MHALERQLAAGRDDRLGAVGVDDRVLLVEHLEDAVGRGARVEREREQEADRLHRPAQHRRHREERDELGRLQLADLNEVDAGAEAQREGQVGQQHQPEPDPADRPGLAQLGLAERLGLAGELLQRVLAAPEGLEHTDAVDALLDGGREVAGLVLALARERAVRLLEAVARVPERARNVSRKIVPSTQCQRKSSARADDDGDDVDDEKHDAERHPAAQHADVLHHAAEQLPRLPPVVECDGQALQARVEGAAQVVLDLGRRDPGRTSGAARP